MSIRKWLDNNIAPHVEKGGKYQFLYPLYEAVDTIFYSPGIVPKTAPHIRDGIDLKRIMFTVYLCVFPAIIMGCYNVGYQALAAGVDISNSFISLFWYGFLVFLPIYLVTFIVGGFWEVFFAIKRNHEVSEGFFVTSVLFACTMPPTVPLWQVALGISFGVIVAKEMFGGTGYNFLNPALSGRAFLYFAYPAQMSGSEVWVAADGYSGATALSVAADSGMAALTSNFSWQDAFFGLVPGSIAETSTLFILLGGVLLLTVGIASWRIVLGVFLGMVLTATLFNLIGSDTNYMFAMPAHWHFVLGGFAFAMMFMATDPVSAAMTNTGRLLFGLLIGFLTVLIRVVNPGYPEGVMLAILLANVFAPTIDYLVVNSNIKRRKKRLLQNA
jgi:Na+-transporting NADH:ubiquinone oxidoreductase subunit B